jgi:iron complex outermembrane receptor protein
MDTRIPGYSRSSKERLLRPQADEKKDKLPNSFNKQDNVAVAATRIFDRGHLGLSFNHFNTLYGSVAEDDVSIDMTQNRFELHGELRPESGVVRKYKLKSAQSDYFHKEIADGATGTTFKNRGNESRLEALTKTKRWDGVTGLQTQIFSFEADGDEAFLPSSDTSRISLFTFQQYSFGRQAVRFGGRLENHSIGKRSSTKFGASDKVEYLGHNASVGHCFDFTRESTLESSVSYTERAPTAQELYSNGKHVATGTFEIGDSQLIKEKATAFEVTFKNITEKNVFTGSIYSQVFKDYISLNPNGQENGGVPEYEYRQTDALFYGVDLDHRSSLGHLPKGQLWLVNKFDWVRAKDTDNGDNLPRISPPRLTLGFDYVSDRWSADIETQYVAHQTKVSSVETRTDDYFMTNLGYTFHMIGNLSSLNLFARVRNIFNVEARNHVSTLKDIAPLPGRNVMVGAEIQL